MDTTASLQGFRDFDEWEFSSNKYGTVVFDEPGQFTFPIATRSDPDTTSPNDAIKLEVIVSKE